MMPGRFPWLIALFALGGLAGCFRQVSDASAAPSLPRYTGSAPWTIEGVRPGQTLADVKLLLGEPRETRGTANQPTLFWSRPEVAVTFDTQARVTEVMGSTLMAGGQVIVQGGASEAEVVQILGPGRVQKSSRPKGSGVISLGRVHIGTTLIYDHDGVRFELPVFGEASGHFLARRVP